MDTVDENDKGELIWLLKLEVARLKRLVESRDRFIARLIVKDKNWHPEWWQPISTAPKDGKEILICGLGSKRSHKCKWNANMTSFNPKICDFEITGCWETLCCSAWFEPSEAELWRPLSKSGHCGCQMDIYYRNKPNFNE